MRSSPYSGLDKACCICLSLDFLLNKDVHRYILMCMNTIHTHILGVNQQPRYALFQARLDILWEPKCTLFRTRNTFDCFFCKKIEYPKLDFEGLEIVSVCLDSKRGVIVSFATESTTQPCAILNRSLPLWSRDMEASRHRQAWPRYVSALVCMCLCLWFQALIHTHLFALSYA